MKKSIGNVGRKMSHMGKCVGIFKTQKEAERCVLSHMTSGEMSTYTTLPNGKYAVYAK